MISRSTEVKTLWRNALACLMRCSAKADANRRLSDNAIVFAPHPDDETLGCGGTIIKKKRAGAEIKIVFMTDGTRSHRHLISAKELKAKRRSEGLGATQKLGLGSNDAIFFEFEDGTLLTRHKRATERATEVMQSFRPKEIYIPYLGDSVPDHVATNRIVLTASKGIDEALMVNEYPIWFWQHWPWTGMSITGRREIPRASWRSLTSSLRLVTDFRHQVYIGDVLDQKRSALEAHASQTTRLIPDPRWLTLGDVSNGEFLACFFQDFEVFRRYRLKNCNFDTSITTE